MGFEFKASTLVVFIFTGDNGDRPADHVRFFYIDEAYLSDKADPDEGPLLRVLLDKVDGVHYDACSARQRQRLDLLFDWLETGRERGWVDEQSYVAKTRPPGGGVVTRVVTVTATP